MTYAILRDYIKLQRGTTYKGKLLGLPGPVLLGLASIAPDGGFRADSLKTYGGESPEKLLLKPGEVYISLKDVTQSGNLLGAVSRVPKNVPMGRLTQDTVKLIFSNQNISKEYIYWLLRTPQYRAYCRARGTGTTNLNLSREDFLNFPVPDYTPGRRDLVSILEAIEGKIAINQHMNMTLESIASAIFKSWFIDFNPVRAKAEGKQPFGMDEETAALFPSEFEDSELGEIPKGWQFGKIEDMIEIARETINPANFPDEVFYHYSIPAYDNGRKPITERGSGIKSNKGLLIPGCVLLSKLNPETPRSWFPTLDGEYRSICSTEFLVVLPKECITSEYLYSFFSSDEFCRRFLSLVTGTSGSHQRVKREDLGTMDIVLPPMRLISSFTDLANPIYRLAYQNIVQSSTLMGIRDALLPKLLSGELRVSRDQVNNLQARLDAFAPTK